MDWDSSYDEGYTLSPALVRSMIVIILMECHKMLHDQSPWECFHSDTFSAENDGDCYKENAVIAIIIENVPWSILIIFREQLRTHTSCSFSM